MEEKRYVQFVSMATWRLPTLWRFTVPANNYPHKLVKLNLMNTFSYMYTYQYKINLNEV